LPDRGTNELEDFVEIKIGVLHTSREIVVESAQAPAEVEELVSTTLASGKGTLSLTDERGRKVLVPTAVIAYVEIAQPDARRVGFVGS
jgi:Protein of unknown function (DUF3107)